MRAQELITEKLPALMAHLTDAGIEVAMFATQWFMCLYVNTFPTETSMRVWDVLVYEGPKVLFRVAVAVLKLLEEELSATQDIGQILSRLSRPPPLARDPDAFIKYCFKGVGVVRRKRIAALRDRARSVMSSSSGGAS